MAGADILLTGARGFVGAHVAARATARSLTVERAEGDVRQEAVEDALRARPAAAVIHLASSWRTNAAAPWRALADDVVMAGNVLAAVSRYAPDAPVLLAGSAAQYGLGLTRPILESDRPGAVSAYGAGKQLVEDAVMNPALRGDVRVIAARAFNHVGPGQGLNAPIAQWCSRITDAEREGTGSCRLPVGRMDVVRDFLDVRDVADAYLDLVASEAEGVFNVCSGRGWMLRDVVALAAAATDIEVVVEEDPALVRSIDPPMVVGDPGRLTATTGWQQAIPLERSIGDAMNDWRRRAVGHNPASTANRGET